jgi:ELWxxDGT repeat protein
LWKSDGTAAGTVLVKDIVPGTVGSSSSQLVAVGSRQVFFAADDGTTGTEIWRSDGTAAGTKLFFDLRPGRESSAPMELTLFRGKLLLSMLDGLVGREVFTLDPGATYHPVGRGCRAAGLAPTLEASDPVLGGSARVAGTRAVSSSGILAVGVLPGRPIALPAGAGGVGCTVYVDLARPFVPIFLTPKAGNWSFITQIPNTPASKGRSVVIQAVFGPSGTPPLGLDLTRGVVLTLGQ